MCILFFHANANPKENEFALVLINNRDEQFTRPTEVCHFWKERPYIIGGRDAFPGKEGGTWLGLSKKGKIGVLLNILQPEGEVDSQAKGRGSLVADFLKSDVDASTYLKEIAKEWNLYNNFNLVTIELKPAFTDFVIGHYNNVYNDPPIFLQSGFHGVGNCSLESPWRKIPYGKEHFTEICRNYPTVDTKETLIEKLIELLNNDTRHFPDPQLEKQGEGKHTEILASLSALKVKIPAAKYGTRTNTVVLIDRTGHVDYIERTMQEPIDAYNPKWITNRHIFEMDMKTTHL